MKILLSEYTKIARGLILRVINNAADNTCQKNNAQTALEMFDVVVKLVEDPKIEVNVKEALDEKIRERLRLDGAYAELSKLDEMIVTGVHKGVIKGEIRSRMDTILSEIEKLK